MPEEKISGVQAVVLLFLSRAFQTLNYIPAFHDAPDGMSTLWGTGVALVIELLILIPALLLEQRYRGQNVITVGYNRWKPLGMIFALLYAFTMLLQLVGSLAGFEYFLTNAVYPNSSAVFIVLTMCAACFWAAGRGLEGLGRAAGIVFVFFLLSVLLISGASMSSIDMLNVRPSLDNPLGSAFRAGIISVSKTSEIFLLLLLFPKIKGNKTKCAFGLTISVFLFDLVTSFLLLAVLGKFGQTQTFPYYTLASVSDVFIFQRLDSLHMAIWTFITFLRLTLLIGLIVYCMKMVLPMKTHKAVLPVLFVVTVGASIWLSYSTAILEASNLNTSILVVLLTAILPLSMLLLPAARQKHPQEGDTLI